MGYNPNMKEFYCKLIDGICQRANVKPHFKDSEYEYFTYNLVLGGPCGEGVYPTSATTKNEYLDSPCPDAVRVLREYLRNKAKVSGMLEYRSQLYQVTAVLNDEPLAKIEKGVLSEL